MKVTPDRESMMEDMWEGEDVEGVENEGTEDEGVRIDVQEPSQEVDADEIVEQLAAIETDLTIADLRKLPGADKHTDEELEKMWQEALNPPKNTRAYKFYKDKDEVSDLDSLTASELLQLQVSYNAMGKEQRRTFDEVIRNAQLGHFNEARMSQIQQQRDEMARRYSELEPKYQQQTRERQLLEYALTQYSMGNSGPMEQFIKAFQAETSKLPDFLHEETTDNSAMEAAGQRVYYETVVPAAADLAARYGADQREIAQAILAYVENEPEQFMSPQRLQEIIYVDLPILLEKNGYTQEAQQPAENTEIEALKKELAELKASQKNEAVKKAKNKKAPSAGGGVTPSAGDSMPSIKNRNDMKDYLRS